MKFKYDLDYVAKITGISIDKFEILLKYFNSLPIMGKLEAFYISKLIEEEDEFAFLQHHFDREKVAEYGFSLFILAVDRLYLLENKDTENSKLSSYKLRKISRLKSLRDEK